ncbi:MAG: type II toxin-antitoxin system prevent-host-death family antitoxin [Rhodocyclaceae bacterium]|nr:type II toxin-antitoxin system prevent-host-death family antitoxin [Rhodocyclaceae bacterium]
MFTVNIHEAKTHLSRLVDQAAKGESFIIAKAGHPMVKVIPLELGEAGTAQRLGFMAGELAVPDDFDRMGEAEMEAMFGGGQT